MTDIAVGFLLLGIGLVVILGVVFVIASRTGGARGTAAPPRGVHLPPPSLLPVVMSVGASLLGAGLAFRGNWVPANPFLAIPGLIVLVVGIVGWIRAANREWRETERGAHDGGAAH